MLVQEQVLVDHGDYVRSARTNIQVLKGEGSGVNYIWTMHTLVIAGGVVAVTASAADADIVVTVVVTACTNKYHVKVM